MVSFRGISKLVSSLLLLFEIILFTNFIIIISGLYPLDKEITLSNHQGIVVDKGKVIYIGIGPPVNRIQVYDSCGNFIENIKVDGGRYKYCFTINKGIPVVKQYSQTEVDFKLELFNVINSSSTLSQCDKQLMYPVYLRNKNDGTYEVKTSPFKIEVIKNHREILVRQGFFYKMLDINTIVGLFIFTWISFILLNLTKILKHYNENGSLKFLRLIRHIFTA